ncbi:hypothetical protein H5410_001259 [Solanum commersonii]|uniref:Uncharacterized protein n=1 Tax=Solanum commersonii TaxID=4109 RepID=A0A9J6AYE8_SOLCO|nr:hypothetical protein H5410_001259 [Solanum commersonii]
MLTIATRSNGITFKYCIMGYYVDAPVDCCCEECDIGKEIMFSLSGLENVHYEGPRHRINREKEVRTGKMRYLHVEEALGLSSSINKYGSPRINTVSSRVVSTKSIAIVARRIFTKPRAQISNSFREKSKVKCSPLYCMMGYYVDAPVDWCREECDIGKGIIFSSSGLENVHYERHRHRINWKKEVQTEKMRYLHVEEALGLSSSIKKYESPRINAVSSKVVSTKSMATMVRGIFSKPRVQISNSFREKSVVQRPLGSTGYTKPQNLQIAKNTEQSKKIVQLSKDIA